MDIHGRLSEKVYPLVRQFFRTHHGFIPVKIQQEIELLVGKVVIAACNVYSKILLQDKYGIDIDLSQTTPWTTDPKALFLKRFLPCEICGESRVRELCHIIPRAEGGPDEEWNSLSLCKNHHKLFDGNRLTEFEWAVIEWGKKDPRARQYAFSVRYKKHESFWKYRVPIGWCECGNDDFTISFEETQDRGYHPGTVFKRLTCTRCQKQYVEVKDKRMDYQWWQEYIIDQLKKTT